MQPESIGLVDLREANPLAIQHTLIRWASCLLWLFE